MSPYILPFLVSFLVFFIGIFLARKLSLHKLIIFIRVLLPLLSLGNIAQYRLKNSSIDRFNLAYYQSFCRCYICAKRMSRYPF